jgi:hypothetical protein
MPREKLRTPHDWKAGRWEPPEVSQVYRLAWQALAAGSGATPDERVEAVTELIRIAYGDREDTDPSEL